MLPLAQKIAFLVFAVVTVAGGAWGFFRLYRRIARGRVDADLRWDRVGVRIWYALTTTLLQTRTFKKRPWVSFFHSFIFYGFTFYILVNFVDAVEGYFPVEVSSGSWWGTAYNLFADVLSLLVLVGVVALILIALGLTALVEQIENRLRRSQERTRRVSQPHARGANSEDQQRILNRFGMQKIVSVIYSLIYDGG